MLYKYVLTVADNVLILGHRLSELCGHGPTLETDIALTNISLDLFGQVRSYYQYAASLKGETTTEDDIAFLRFEKDYYNAQLVEQPNTDFAYVIMRQFLFDAFHLPLLEQLCNSKDETINAIAHKSIKEVRYHYRFSSEWVKRLGAGTEVSKEKMQVALNYLYPFSFELFKVSPQEAWAYDNGVGADIKVVEEAYNESLKSVIHDAGLTIPGTAPRKADGKLGRHTEHMGRILAELQFMQRAYPNMQW